MPTVTVVGAGAPPPSAIARRLLGVIRDDPDYWRKKPVGTMSPRKDRLGKLMNPVSIDPPGSRRGVHRPPLHHLPGLGVDDDWMLIDCPHPVRKMLVEGSAAAGIPLDLDRISCRGGQPPARGPRLRPGRLRLSTRTSCWGAGPGCSCIRRSPPGVWNGLLAAGMEFSPGAARHAARSQATRRILRADRPGPHLGRSPAARSRSNAAGRSTAIPTTAFRIHAGGRTFGFSADTAYRPHADRLARPRRSDRPRGDDPGPPGVHTPYEKLAALPAELLAR